MIDSGQKTKAVILCGGQGTRIRDVSEVIPKPMLSIGGRPILWHIMKGYAHFGIEDFVLCLGYKGWIIKEFFLQYNSMINDFTVTLGNHQEIEFHSKPEEANWRITLADTGEAAQTGARILKARRYLEDCDRFCVTYGDGVSDVDHNRLLREQERIGTVGLVTGVRPLGRFGELDYEGDIVKTFAEKPDAVGGYINGGFMVFDSSRAFSYFRPGDDLNLEREVLPRMAADGELAIYRHDSFWQCMDTPREYDLLNDIWNSRNVHWKVW